jgi:hypothetical protein
VGGLAAGGARGGTAGLPASQLRVNGVRFAITIS